MTLNNERDATEIGDILFRILFIIGIIISITVGVTYDNFWLFVLTMFVSQIINFIIVGKIIWKFL